MLPALNCNVNIFNTFLNLRPVRDEQVWLFWESFLSYFENIELRLMPCIFYFALVIQRLFCILFLSLLDSYTIPTKDVIVMAAYLHNSKA